MQPSQITVQLPNSDLSSQGRSLTWLWIIGAMLAGVAGGWISRETIENREDLIQHAEVLKPFLAYNRDYDQMGARAMNDDMRVVSFHVYQVWNEGLDLREVLDLSMPVEQVPPNLKQLTVDRLLENHQQAIDFGLYTPENLAKLCRGNAPKVSQGKYSGKECQVEHIVPKNVVPLMDNLLVNLEWLPQPLNASKSDSITPRALEYAQRYYSAGLMSEDDLMTVKAKAKN